jgi:ankyrin repeat protein
MASLEQDAKALQMRVHDLQMRVYDLAEEGETNELNTLLNEHPDIDVDEYKDEAGCRALFVACRGGHTICARLLIDHRADVHAKINGEETVLFAPVCGGHLSCMKLLVQNGAAGDVNCQDDRGFIPLMDSASSGRLTVAQYLLEQKADVHYRISEECDFMNMDALWCAMCRHATDRTPGFPFAILSCNTDAKNVKIEDRHVTTNVRDDGIYQEPLERTLEYLGLSMSKDQVVNTSIDGEAVRRALIPGHLLNANHWFNKHHKKKLHAQLKREWEACMQRATELQMQMAAVYP